VELKIVPTGYQGQEQSCREPSLSCFFVLRHNYLKLGFTF